MKQKKILTLILSLVLLVQLAGVTAFAAEDAAAFSVATSNSIQGVDFRVVSFAVGDETVETLYVLPGNALGADLPDLPDGYVGWFADGKPITADTVITDALEITALTEAPAPAAEDADAPVTADETAPEAAAQSAEESAEEPHKLTEEEFLLTYYPDKIELYKQYRQYADLQLDPDTTARIKAYVDEKYPVEPVVTEEPAVEEVPVEEQPAEEKPVEEQPADEAPVEEDAEPETEAPVDEQPVEETSAEEVPIEEQPADEVPVEEEPVEEPHELTEEEFLLTYYPDKIELYKQYREFADLQLDPDTTARIKAYVDEKYPVEPAVTEEPVVEETPAEEEAPVDEVLPTEEDAEPETETPIVDEQPEEETPADEAESETTEETSEEPADEAPVEEVAEPEADAATEDEGEAEPETEAPVDEQPTEEAPVEEEPADEAPVEEVVEEPVVEAPLPEPKAVTLTSSLGSTISLGAPVTLTGILEDVDEFSDVIYVWEVDKGSGYERVEDANGSSYTFAATVESLSWNWRLSVYYR